MPQPINPFRVDALHRICENIELTVAESLHRLGVPLPEHRYIGVDEPPQDRCPEIAVWVLSLRTVLPAQSREVVHTLQFEADIKVRVSDCFIDIDESGEPLDGVTLTALSLSIYQIYYAMYVGWVRSQVDDAENSDICPKCTGMTIGSLAPFTGGGCAGAEFTLTIRF